MHDDLQKRRAFRITEQRPARVSFTRAERDYNQLGEVHPQLNRKALLLLASIALPLAAQRGAGELRLTVKDPSGLGLEASGSLVGQATQVRRLFTTNPEGQYSIRPLPF